MLSQNNDHTPGEMQHRAYSVARGNPLFDLLRLAIRPQNVSSNSPTANWIKHHPIRAVVGLAYVLTWIGLIPLIRDPGIALHADLGHASNPSVLVYVFIGVLGCLWAALIVAGAVNGVKGRYDLLGGYLKWHVGIQWYAVVLLGPAIVLANAIGLDFILTGKMPVFPMQSLLPSALISGYAVFIIRYMFGNFEEICWRASVLPRLQARNNALASSLIVGIVQGVWHLPYLFVSGHYVQSIGLSAIIIQSVAMSIVATWIYNNTRGSLLMAALFHAAYDALSQFQGNDLHVLYLSIGVWCTAAIVLVILFGAQHLSRKPDSEFAYAVISTDIQPQS